MPPTQPSEAMRAGRARVGIVLLAALTLASLFMSQAQASPYHEMDGQRDTSSPLEQLTGGNARIGQAFRPAANYTLTRASLYVSDRGNDDSLAVRVHPDVGGLPDETSVLAGALNNSASAYGWADFDFVPALPVVLGVPYWIVAESTNGIGNGYAWRYDGTDRYPVGNAATSSGPAWTPLPGDMAFAVFGWTAGELTIVVTPDRAAVAAGETLGYRIDLANAGTEDATDVWVNVTLDGRLRFAGAGGAGSVSVAGDTVSFRLAAIPTGNATCLLNATAGTLLDDGGFLALPTTMEYTDGVSRQAAATTALVEIRAPRVVADLNPPSANVRPGALVTFRVTVSNEGRELAAHVWLNETPHASLTYLSDTAPVAPEQVAGRQSWHFLDVAPGTESFNVTLQVDPQVSDSTVMANFLSVEYTDRDGGGLVRAKSNTIWFTVVDGAAGTGPWLWGSFAISASVVGGGYLFLARRRLRTEEIFLIHRSGVLLVHMSKSLKSDHDTDILSGMFTAIMNFVRDAFHYGSARQELHGLDIGQFRVHVRKGDITYLAIVHSGKPTRWVAHRAREAVQDVETEYGKMLRTWDGDVGTLAGIRDILRGHFLSPTGPSRSWRRFRAAIARLDQTFKPMRPL